MFHTLSHRMRVACVGTLLLCHTGCMASFEDIRTTETRNQFDENGNPISQTTTIGTKGGSTIEIDDRVIDVLQLFPRFRPIYVPTQPPAAIEQPPRQDRAPQVNARTPQPTSILNYFEIKAFLLSFMPGAITIDDSDWLDFEVVWNVEFHDTARVTILDTFEHATFPNDRTLSYAGPAPEGIELAALLGLRELSIPAELGSITWFDPGFSPPAFVELFTLLIDVQTDTVTLNGIEVMQLGSNAHAMNP